MNKNQSQGQKYKNHWGYVRWSSDGQEEGNTEARQLEYINEYAKKLGKAPIKIFIDKGVSALKGDNLKREWFKLKSVVGKDDVILTEDVDRITRKGSRTFYNTLGEIVDDRKAFIILTSPRMAGFEINGNNYEDDWNLKVNNSVSSIEGKKRMERIKYGVDTMMASLRKGKWALVGSKPWWIQDNLEKECYEVIEERAKVVRWIYRMYNDGLSIRMIVKALNENGISPRRNKEWSISTVRRMLRTKSVLGYFPQGDGKVKLYPPIIDEGIYEMTRDKMRAREGYTGPTKYDLTQNLFKKIMFCEGCGKLMHLVMRFPVWQCPTCKIQHRVYSYEMRDGKRRYKKMDWKVCHQCGGATEPVVSKKNYEYKCVGGLSSNNCNLMGIRMDRVEDSIRTLLSKSDILARFVAEDVIPEPYRLEKLKCDLEVMKKKETKLSSIITNDPDPSEMLIKSLKELEVEDRRLTREIDIEEATMKSRIPTLEAIREFSQSKLMEKWNDPSSRLAIRELIRNVISKIVVTKNKKEKSCVVHFTGEIRKPIKIKLENDGFSLDGNKFPYEVKY